MFQSIKIVKIVSIDSTNMTLLCHLVILLYIKSGNIIWILEYEILLQSLVKILNTDIIIFNSIIIKIVLLIFCIQCLKNKTV